MNQSPDTENRALRLLSELPPPDEDMQHRILHRLRQQDALTTTKSLGAPSSAESHPAMGGIAQFPSATIPQRPSRSQIFWPIAAALALATTAFFHHIRTVPASNRASNQLPQSTPQRASQQLAFTTPPLAPHRHAFAVHAETKTQPTTSTTVSAEPLPLTHQELLLLALARSPNAIPSSLTRSETLNNHGLGNNTIFELNAGLNHDPLPPLQPASLGDFE